MTGKCCPLISAVFVAIGSILVAEPIRIGAIFAKTGEAAHTNLNHLPGLYLAVEEINRDGGILGSEIEIVEYDSRSTSIGASRAAHMAVQDGVAAVIGSVWSSHSLAAARVLQAAGVPMISPSSTNPEVTLVGDFVFRACYVDTFQGLVMARFAYYELGIRHAAVVFNTGRLYSADLAAVFAERFAEIGGNIVYRGEYVNNTTDFRGIFREIVDTPAEAVFISSNTTESIIAIRQARAEGLGVPFLGGDGWAYVKDKYSGPELSGVYYCDHWHPDIAEDVNRRFIELFSSWYGPIDTSGAPLTYDACRLLADAIRRAGVLEGRAIQQALLATADFPGVTGRITMDENGNPEKKAFIVTFADNRTVLVAEIGE
jgi:branched-chain amino acid transport system substrate-binding protein